MFLWINLCLTNLKYEIFEQGSAVLTVSFGTARPMKLDKIIKEEGKDRVLQTEWLTLEPGSLFILGSKTNHNCNYSGCSEFHNESNWQHSIPEVKEDVGVRISLTWRKIKM